MKAWLLPLPPLSHLHSPGIQSLPLLALKLTVILLISLFSWLNALFIKSASALCKLIRFEVVNCWRWAEPNISLSFFRFLSLSHSAMLLFLICFSSFSTKMTMEIFVGHRIFHCHVLSSFLVMETRNVFDSIRSNVFSSSRLHDYIH